MTRVALRTLLIVLAASIGLGHPPLPLAPAGLAEAQVRGGAAAGRRFTTLDALRQFPGFYHLQNILVRGEFAEDGKRLMLRSDAHEMRVVLSEGATSKNGAVEVRGVLIDIGRLEPSDPRLSGLVDERDADRWPRPGEELVVRVTGVANADSSSTATVRSLTLEPWKFDGQNVTIVGNFRGRNLFGDLAGSPNKSKYDFVLRGAEGAIWVTSLRPKGDKFDLDINRRVDSDRWLEVTGRVFYERGLVSIEATRLKLATAPEMRAASDEPATPTVALQPVQVVFSSPTDGETDVPPGAPIRVQFSRGLNESSLADDIRISYVGSAPASTAGTTPTLAFGLSYDAASRSIQIKMKEPFEPFRTVRVQLLDGVTGFDGAPVTPWTLTFSVGN